MSEYGIQIKGTSPLLKGKPKVEEDWAAKGGRIK